MNYVTYFKSLFESIPDYKKIVLLILLIKNDKKFLQECRFLKSDNESLTNEFKSILIEQNEEYLSFIKYEEESLIERFFEKLNGKLIL